jgi:hypothetical protein
MKMDTTQIPWIMLSVAMLGMAVLILTGPAIPFDEVRTMGPIETVARWALSILAVAALLLLVVKNPE